MRQGKLIYSSTVLDEPKSQGPRVHVRGKSTDETLDLDQFEALIRKGKVGPTTLVCFPLVTGETWVPAGELEIFRGLYSEERIVFDEQFNLARFPLLTVLLGMLNVGAYLAIQYASAWYGDDAPLVLGAKAAPLIEEAGQTWRLLTFNFVHADHLHLMANLAYLMLLGLALENAYSWRSYLVILASSAACSGFASYLFTEAASAGASGIVFGILGGLVVFGVKHRTLIPRRYAYFFGWALVPLLLITVYAGLTQPLVDHFGHGGGLLGGGLACVVLRAELLEKRPANGPGWLRAGVVVVAACLLVFFGGWIGRLAWETTTYRDELGLEVEYPETWDDRGYDAYGYVELQHGTYPYVRMSLGAVERAQSLSAQEALRRHMELQVEQREEEGEIERVTFVRRDETEIDGHRAAMASYTYESEGRRLRRDVYVVTVNRLEYLVSLTTLDVWHEAYGRTFADVIESVRITDPSQALHETPGKK